MREILLRGKRIDNGEWIFGSLIHRGDYCCILPPDGVLHDSEVPYMDSDLGTFDGKAIPVDPETVGQYTGLPDKNGKRIFEGDLLVLATSRTHEVKFADGSFYMEGTTFPIHYGEKFTIVGNRWDNPELLVDVAVRGNCVSCGKPLSDEDGVFLCTKCIKEVKDNG